MNYLATMKLKRLIVMLKVLDIKPLKLLDKQAFVLSHKQLAIKGSQYCHARIFF